MTNARQLLQEQLGLPVVQPADGVREPSPWLEAQWPDTRYVRCRFSQTAIHAVSAIASTVPSC